MFDLKNKIKEAPISSIIGRYITLTPQGSVMKGLCPFHDDHKPSLSVDDRKNMFKCFVCDTGGDALSFVQKYKNVDFKEALKETAHLLGLPYEEYRVKKVPPKIIKAQKLLHRVCSLYHKIAMKNSSFSNFATKRRLSPKAIKDFFLGMAPNGNFVVNTLDTIDEKKKRLDCLELSLEIGLIQKNRYGNFYDTFRNRIVFPIFNWDGQVVGLGGRALDDEEQIKYLNSKESFVFNKKNLCYGLDTARPFIRKQNSVILVEGYMDVISLHQCGFKNAVAVMGVGVSEYSLRLLKSLTENIYLGMDCDKAGLKASKRINESCLKGGIIPYHLDFHPHKDPDEFLQAKGPDALRDCLKNSSSFIDTLIDETIPKEIPTSPDRKLAVLKKLFSLLAPLEDGLPVIERLASIKNRLKLNSTTEQITQTYKDFLKDQISRPKMEKGRQAASLPSPSLELERGDHHILCVFTDHPSLFHHKKTLEILDFLVNNDVKSYLLKTKQLIGEIDESDPKSYAKFILDIIDKNDGFSHFREFVGKRLCDYRPHLLPEQKEDKMIADLEKRVRKGRLKAQRIQLEAARKQCVNEKKGHSLLQQIQVIDQEIIQQNKSR